MADPTMARIVITANIEIAQRHLYEHDYDLAGKLQRALTLALQINDLELVLKVKDAIISSEAFFAAKGNLKHRGFSYDILVENNKVKLTDDELHEIIATLEQWLDIVSNPGNQDQFDPFAAEEAALRLAKYYRRISDAEKMRAALLKYGNAFLEPSKTAAALVASAWLQKVYATYRQFSLLKDADEIAVRLREIGAKTKDEMVAISGEVKIPKDKLEAYITEMIEDALRNLVEMAGGPVYKPNRSGGLSLKTLDEILRDDIIAQVLGENAAFYLRVLLTDQRGWNIRNTVCHGMAAAGNFSADMSDRILHTLLLLGQIRLKDDQDTAEV